MADRQVVRRDLRRRVRREVPLLHHVIAPAAEHRAAVVHPRAAQRGLVVLDGRLGARLPVRLDVVAVHLAVPRRRHQEVRGGGPRERRDAVVWGVRDGRDAAEQIDQWIAAEAVTVPAQAASA